MQSSVTRLTKPVSQSSLQNISIRQSNVYIYTDTTVQCIHIPRYVSTMYSYIPIHHVRVTTIASAISKVEAIQRQQMIVTTTFDHQGNNQGYYTCIRTQIFDHQGNNQGYYTCIRTQAFDHQGNNQGSCLQQTMNTPH